MVNDVILSLVNTSARSAIFIENFYDHDLHFFSISPDLRRKCDYWPPLDLCLPFAVCLFAIVVKGENYCNVMPVCVLFLHIEAEQ